MRGPIHTHTLAPLFDAFFNVHSKWWRQIISYICNHQKFMCIYLVWRKFELTTRNVYVNVCHLQPIPQIHIQCKFTKRRKRTRETERFYDEIDSNWSMVLFWLVQGIKNGQKSGKKRIWFKTYFTLDKR